MIKEIKLTQGKVAIVDDEDYAWLNQWKWCYSTAGYAIRAIRINGKRKTIFMHRIILKTPNDLFTDHINRNKLDNRRENLRICTASQNKANQSAQHNNTSGKKGVTWQKDIQRWKAQINFKQKIIYLGDFKDIEEAARAYAKKSFELFGEFASTE
jgi:hypothetical protein